MGIYNSAVITNTGQALLAQSVAGNDLKFTTVKTSNYTYPSGTSLADLTTLTGIKQSKNITGANVYNSRVIKISAMVDNAGVAAEYSINTIGVYATIGTAAEQLFAVITAQEADKMPAFNSRPYSYIYDMNMTMQGTANITVTVNNAGFVNINDLNNALDGVNDSITDLDETVNDRIDTLSSSVDTRISALNDALATTNNNKQNKTWTQLYSAPIFLELSTPRNITIPDISNYSELLIKAGIYYADDQSVPHYAQTFLWTPSAYASGNMLINLEIADTSRINCTMSFSTPTTLRFSEIFIKKGIARGVFVVIYAR